jgi:hypothetical protein
VSISSTARHPRQGEITGGPDPSTARHRRQGEITGGVDRQLVGGVDSQKLGVQSGTVKNRGRKCYSLDTLSADDTFIPSAGRPAIPH